MRTEIIPYKERIDSFQKGVTVSDEGGRVILPPAQVGNDRSFLYTDNIVQGYTGRYRNLAYGLDSIMLARSINSAIYWIVNQFLQPQIAMSQRKPGEMLFEFQYDHAATRLMLNPGGLHSVTDMWEALITNLIVNGNAMLVKGRNIGGRVVELIHVDWNRVDFSPPPINEYRFITPLGESRQIELENVIHFRYRYNENEPYMGISPIRSVLTELEIDKQAAQYVLYILQNRAVPGMVVGPELNTGDHLNDESTERLKAAFADTRIRQNAGSTIVFNHPLKIQELGFEPQQVDVRTQRAMVEKVVSAILGVPALVVGFNMNEGASSATMLKEARREGFEGSVVPLLHRITSALNRYLLPDFESTFGRYKFDFDLSSVRVLQEDRLANFEHVARMYRMGVFTREEARGLFGLPAEIPEGHTLAPIGSVGRSGVTIEENDRLESERGTGTQPPSSGTRTAYQERDVK